MFINAKRSHVDSNMQLKPEVCLGHKLARKEKKRKLLITCT